MIRRLIAQWNSRERTYAVVGYGYRETFREHWTDFGMVWGKHLGAAAFVTAVVWFFGIEATLHFVGGLLVMIAGSFIAFMPVALLARG